MSIRIEPDKCCEECAPEYINGRPSCGCECHAEGREH